MFIKRQCRDETEGNLFMRNTYLTVANQMHGRNRRTAETAQLVWGNTHSLNKAALGKISKKVQCTSRADT